MSKKPVKEEKLVKEKYNAVYLGWKQCTGLYGMEVISPIIHDMINGPRPDTFMFDDLPRVVIGVSRKELKITQTITKKPGKTETIKFHVIPMKELMFAARGAPPNECVVGCIYLGLNKETKGWTHVHAYLCENSLAADTLTRHLYQYINTTYHKDRLIRIERDLVKKGHIVPRTVKVETSPLDEMGFPRQTGGVLAEEPVYGTSGDVSVYGSSAESSVCEESVVGYQKYLMCDGGAFKIPRVSPSGDGRKSQDLVDHAHVGFTTRPELSGYSVNPSEVYQPRPVDPYQVKPTEVYQPRPAEGFTTRPAEGYQARLTEGYQLNRQSSPVPPTYHRPLQAQHSSSSQPSSTTAYPGGAATYPGGVAAYPQDYRPQCELEAGPPDYDGANGPDVIESALAAELRQKLGRGAILLPPKDYDTVSRTQGNLMGIEERRSQNERIVGKSGVNTRMNHFEWSGK